MNRRSLTVVAALLVLCSALLSGAAMAQSRLEQLAQEGQMEWLAGRWTATTDEGKTITLIYRWQLEKNMVSVSLRMEDYSYQGMIFCVPGADEVREVGIDSKGNMVKSQWDASWEGAVCKREVFKTEGGTENTSVKMINTDKDTMTVKIYAIEYGTVANEPWATLQFKRQPQQQRPAARQNAKPARAK